MFNILLQAHRTMYKTKNMINSDNKRSPQEITNNNLCNAPASQLSILYNTEVGAVKIINLFLVSNLMVIHFTIITFIDSSHFNTMLLIFSDHFFC